MINSLVSGLAARSLILEYPIALDRYHQWENQGAQNMVQTLIVTRVLNSHEVF